MISGLLPVVGVPLPFISYGGSNLLAISIGAALSANLFLNDKAKIHKYSQ